MLGEKFIGRLAGNGGCRSGGGMVGAASIGDGAGAL